MFNVLCDFGKLDNMVVIIIVGWGILLSEEEEIFDWFYGYL